jgi:hypothetical protein
MKVSRLDCFLACVAECAPDGLFTPSIRCILVSYAVNYTNVQSFASLFAMLGIDRLVSRVLHCLDVCLYSHYQISEAVLFCHLSRRFLHHDSVGAKVAESSSTNCGSKIPPLCVNAVAKLSAAVDIERPSSYKAGIHVSLLVLLPSQRWGIARIFDCIGGRRSPARSFLRLFSALASTSTSTSILQLASALA